MTNPTRAIATKPLVYLSLSLMGLLMGCSAVPSLFPVQPPITPTVHVPQVHNGLLAFTGQQQNDTDIYIGSPDGSGLKRLTDTPEYESRPLWRPDGRQIFYSTDKCSAVMNSDGSNQHCLPQLTDPHVKPTGYGTDITLNLSSLVWSPDGTKIAFDDGGQYIFMMSANGTNIHRTPFGGIYLLAAWPSWSPDGTQLAFAERSYEDYSDGDIYIVDADGTDMVRLNESPEEDKYPHWTPDGTHIIYQSRRATVNGIDKWLYIIDREGKNEQRLITLSDSYDEIFWGASPDGSKLLVSTWITTDKSWFLLILDAENYSLLRRLPINLSLDEEVLWSPDSQQILYKDGYQRYHIMNADGTDDHELLIPFEYVRGMSWQPVWK